MYRWVDHTAELELRLEANTQEEVFEDALSALRELLVERMAEAPGERGRRELHASAPDRATLLAEWLSELVYLVETEGFVPERVDRISITPSASRTAPRESLANGAYDLDASVTGTRGSPPHLVKAVTYHRLEMTERDGEWRATVVLDV
jgi:SHS2 domain-containing protein